MFVSIALATYNGEKYLREQLDSILKQSFTEWELIVGDDCSSDRTIEILAEYAQRDSRISIQQNQKNLGFKKNFESIFSRCNGEYIACCDQDDVWTQDHLELLLQNIGENDCIGANALICDNSLNSTKQSTLDFYNVKEQTFTTQDIFKFECYYNLIQGAASLFKRSLLENFVSIPNEVKHHDHWIALNASLRHGCIYIPQIILHYRNHEHNAIGTKDSTIKSTLKSFINASSLRKEIYRSRIAMLEELIPSCNVPNKRQIITEAIQFFRNLQNNTRRISSVFFFIRNYESITLSSYKQIKLFLYRTGVLATTGILL